MNLRKALLLGSVVLLVLLAGCSGEAEVDTDTLNQTVEQADGPDGQKVDTDGDGISDSREQRSSRLNATRSDTDADGVDDGRELRLGTDPSSSDSDGDGLSDRWEINNVTDPTRSDSDGDGLSDGREVNDLATNPVKADTDGDGLSDRTEVRGETSPVRADTDGDGLSDQFESDIGGENPYDPMERDTDDDGLNDSQERRLGTNPNSTDTDGDGRTDLQEWNTTGLDPTERDFVQFEVDPSAGLTRAEIENRTLRSKLQNETVTSVSFLAELPNDRSKRNETIHAAASAICEYDSSVVVDSVDNTSSISERTYLISHGAKVLDHSLGAKIDSRLIETRMRNAREFDKVSKYAPAVATYNRLHNASCGVVAQEPGAKQDFLIASAGLAVDLALIKYQVGYRFAYSGTGYAARKVGLMKLARICGYKCVGAVKSQIHWTIRSAPGKSIDRVEREVITGNLTTDGYDNQTEKVVGNYLERTQNTTVVSGEIVTEESTKKCVERNLGDAAWKLADELDRSAHDLIDGDLPDFDLSDALQVQEVRECALD